MDYEDEGGRLRSTFRCFVCASLAALIGLQMYGYMRPQGHDLEGDFTDIMHAVQKLARGLYEVNLKHEHLETEMERISSTLPSVASAASRAKDALQADRSGRGQHIMDAHDYDRQIANFALESAGARIIDTGATVGHVLYESPVSYVLHVLAAWVCRECVSARAMLRPGTLPGECWPFKGSRGEATIRLLGTVHVTGVSLEHIPPHISATREISSAPRLFQLEGLEYRSDPSPHDFGSFEYDRKGKPIQYFEVQPSTKGYNLVRLRILSNWGHSVYTCVYTVRVHGDLVQGQVTHGTDDLTIDNE